MAPCLGGVATVKVASAIGSLANQIGRPAGLTLLPGVGLAYLALLDRVPENRQRTEEEVRSLTDAARDEL